MGNVTLARCGLVAMLALGMSFAGGSLAETVTVTTAPNAQYFVKLICGAAGCRGIGYRATLAETNLELWRAPTVRRGDLTLSDDGELLVSEGDGELTVYIGGQDVGTLSGSTPIDSVSREVDAIALVARDGQLQRFVPVQPLANDRDELRENAPALTPMLRTPVQEPIEAARTNGSNARSNVELPALTTVKKGATSGPSEPSGSPAAGGQSEPVPALSATAYQCEVNAVMRSGRRVSIVQQGPSLPVATDRAMAYCEGMVGAGSRSPAGKCELLACEERKP